MVMDRVESLGQVDEDGRLCIRAIQRVKGQDKSAVERGMVVGAPVCLKNCNAAGVFHKQHFPVCIKNGPPSKGPPANLIQQWEALESSWASIPVERFRHLESMPQ